MSEGVVPSAQVRNRIEKMGSYTERASALRRDETHVIYVCETLRNESTVPHLKSLQLFIGETAEAQREPKNI